MTVLRSLKHPHVNPILQGFKFTTTVVPSATLNIGSEEAAIARSAAGKATITPTQPLSREGVVIATPGLNIAQGGCALFDTAHSGTALIAELVGTAGAGDDGTGFALTLGYENLEDDRSEPFQNVKNRCAQPRLLPFKLSAAGAVEIGASQGTDSLAASVHSVTLERAYGRAPIVVASPISAAVAAARVTANSVTGFSVEGYDPSGGALQDLPMYCLCLGWDIPDIQSEMLRSVKIPQLSPRVEAFRIDGAAAAIDLGSTDAALTVNGVGDYSLTFTQPFSREPIVLVTGKDYRAQLLAAATRTGCQIGCFEHSGGGYAAVHDEVYVLVVGFDGDEV